MGQVYVNSQNQDVWCRSQKPITDMSMYRPNVNRDNYIDQTCLLPYGTTRSDVYLTLSLPPFSDINSNFPNIQCLCEY